VVTLEMAVWSSLTALWACT